MRQVYPVGGNAQLAATITARAAQVTLAQLSEAITVTGGLAPYTYAWTLTDGSGTSQTGLLSSTSSATPTWTPTLRPGVIWTVTCTVTDADGVSTVATRTQRVGTQAGLVLAYAQDFTGETPATISGASWASSKGTWTVHNDTAAATFSASSAGVTIDANASTNLSAAARTYPGLHRVLSAMVSGYTTGDRLVAHLKMGGSSAIGASQRVVGMLVEDPTVPIGDGGTTERGFGAIWRNNGGTRQTAGLMMGLSSGSSLVQTSRAVAADPAVLGLERVEGAFRVGYSTNTAAYGDPTHASWVWLDWDSVDYRSTVAFAGATDRLVLFAASNAGGAGAKLVAEALSLFVARAS